MSNVLLEYRSFMFYWKHVWHYIFYRLHFVWKTLNTILHQTWEGYWNRSDYEHCKYYSPWSFELVLQHWTKKKSVTYSHIIESVKWLKWRFKTTKRPYKIKNFVWIVNAAGYLCKGTSIDPKSTESTRQNQSFITDITYLHCQCMILILKTEI